jgi:hypothetical protein
MADKLNEKGWKAFTVQHKIDGADVTKRLQVYARLPDDEFSDRLDALADLIKSLDGTVAAVKKDKALAARKDELKAVSVYLAAMQKEAADERKAVELAKAKSEKEAAKSGLQKVDVQIIGKSWNGEPLRGYKIFAEFKAPGFKDVTLAQDIKGGVAQYNDVMIMPVGTARVMSVSTGKAMLAPEGTITFKLPKSGLMVFTAEQEFEEFKLSKMSKKQVTDKFSKKGTAGVDWKIFSAGVEVGSESEEGSGEDTGVEWTVKVGLGTFKLAQK